MFRYEVDPRIKIRDPSAILLGAPIVLQISKIMMDAPKDLTLPIADILRNDQRFIPVLIDSYGGAVYDAIGVREMVLGAGLPVITYVPSKAMSAGGFLAVTMGTRGMRYAAPTATFMVHEIVGMIGGKIGDLEVDVGQMGLLGDVVFGLMDQACHKRDGYFRRELVKRQNTDWYITADEALDLGMIDHIGQPIFEYKIGVNVSLGGKEL